MKGGLVEKGIAPSILALLLPPVLLVGAAHYADLNSLDKAPNTAVPRGVRPCKATQSQFHPPSTAETMRLRLPEPRTGIRKATLIPLPHDARKAPERSRSDLRATVSSVIVKTELEALGPIRPPPGVAQAPPL